MSGGVYNKDTKTYVDNKGNPMSMTLDAAKKLGATITENAKINRSGGVTLNGVTYIGNAVVPNSGGKTANQIQKDLQKSYPDSTGQWVGSGRLLGTMSVLADAKEQPLYNAITSNNNGNGLSNNGFSANNYSGYSSLAQNEKEKSSKGFWGESGDRQGKTYVIDASTIVEILICS